MKILIIFVSILLFIAGNSFKIEQQKRQAGSILGAATKLVITQVAKSIAKYLMHNLVQQSPYEAIMGRTVKITRNGNSIGIQDVSSGRMFTGQGHTPEEAMANASETMITNLLEMGYISIHDLHLAPVFTTTLSPCSDVFPSNYCAHQKDLGSCNQGSAFYTFMKDQCFKTCSGCS